MKHILMFTPMTKQNLKVYPIDGLPFYDTTADSRSSRLRILHDEMNTIRERLGIPSKKVEEITVFVNNSTYPNDVNKISSKIESDVSWRKSINNNMTVADLEKQNESKKENVNVNIDEYDNHPNADKVKETYIKRGSLLGLKSKITSENKVTLSLVNKNITAAKIDKNDNVSNKINIPKPLINLHNIQKRVVLSKESESNNKSQHNILVDDFDIDEEINDT